MLPCVVYWGRAARWLALFLTHTTGELRLFFFFFGLTFFLPSLDSFLPAFSKGVTMAVNQALSKAYVSQQQKSEPLNSSTAASEEGASKMLARANPRTCASVLSARQVGHELFI